RPCSFLEPRSMSTPAQHLSRRAQHQRIAVDAAHGVHVLLSLFEGHSPEARIQQVSIFLRIIKPAGTRTAASNSAQSRATKYLQRRLVAFRHCFQHVLDHVGTEPTAGCIQMFLEYA